MLLGFTLFLHANYIYLTFTQNAGVIVRDMNAVNYWMGIVPEWIYFEEKVGVLCFLYSIALSIIFLITDDIERFENKLKQEQK